MIHVTDYNDEIVDFISHSDGAVIEAEHMLNVADKLETFDFEILTSRTEHMQTRNRIIIEDKDGQYREFIIYNISSDLNGYTKVQTNASALEDIKTAKPVAPHKLDKHTVKEALDYALADTGWEVADDAEWGGTRTTSWTGWHDRISILKQLETTYDMRLSFRVEVGSNKVTKRLVSLKKVEPMFNGEEIVYGDNMLELKRTVDFSDIATALICLGPEDSETGKREIVEIKDDDAQAQFGLPYRYIWDIYEPESSDENMTKERLTTLGRTALNKRKESTVSYDIKGVDLSASAGDMIRVKNEDFTPELYVDAEVVEVTTDLLSGETEYKFGVIKEYTRADVYARFYAMLDTLRERLNNVVSNTDSIISERLEKELASFERYIHKSDTPPLEPKEGDLWLDTSHDGVAVLYRFENGEWVKSSVDDVRDIGGMTREETMYEALKERKSRIEVDYSNVFNQYDMLTNDRYYHYVESDYRLDLENKFSLIKSTHDKFISAYESINKEQPTIGLITNAISRAIDFEIALKEFRVSYNIARADFDAYMRILQSQYTEEKFNEAMETVADSIGGVITDSGEIDVSESLRKRLDDSMDIVARAIGGSWDGNQLYADLPNQKNLNDLNQSLRAYLSGQVDALDNKLGKQIETVVNQAKNEFSVAVNSVEKKVDGIDDFLVDVSLTLGSFGTVLNDNTVQLNILENKINLKADSETVKQMLNAELQPVKSSVQTNKAELEVLSNQIASKVDSVEYQKDKDGLINDIKTNSSEIKQTADSLKSQINSVETYLDGQDERISKNFSAIEQLNDQISFKADSYKVERQLNRALEPIQSSIQTNQAELKILNNQIASKVESSKYNADMNSVTRDLQNATSERKQLAESISQTVSVDEYKKGTENLVKDSDEEYNNPNYLIAEYTLSEPFELNETYTITVKGNVQNTNGGLAILRDKGRYFISRNTPKVDDDIYQITFTANDNTWITDNVRLYNYPSSSRVNAEIEWIKVERGSIATPYSKSPQDTEEVLTRYNTEINQAKESINQRVSYEQFNKSNKTLERLITSLNQTSTGLEFIIDTNGIIQGFNLNKDKFRFDSKMIEFNDGDVVIKDGVTSITQAFINSLRSNTGFIDVLNSTDFTAKRILSTSGSNQTFIEGGYLQSRGRYTRTWFGEAERNVDVAFVVRDGHIRFENYTEDKRLYYSDRGISTFLRGYDDEDPNSEFHGSGVIEFFSHQFDPYIRGLTLFSNRGTIGLKTLTRDIVLDSDRDIKLSTNRGDIQFDLKTENRAGRNSFNMYVKNNPSGSDTDGILRYGSENRNFASGIRFQKTTVGRPVVWITNGNGDIGTGDISVNYAEIRGHIITQDRLNFLQWNDRSAYNQIGVGAVNTYNSIVLASYGNRNAYFGISGSQTEARFTDTLGFNNGNTTYRDIRARSYITENKLGLLMPGEGNGYIGVGGSGAEVRFTNTNGYNGGSTVYRDIRFKNWTATSHERYKYDIEEWHTPVLDVFKNELQLHRFKFKSDKDTHSALFSHGVVLRDNPNDDQFPSEWRSEDGFNGNEVTFWNTKAIQELAFENDHLKARIEELKSQINKIMEMIA